MILKIDRKLIRSADDFQEAVARMKIGSEHRLEGDTGKKIKERTHWKRGTIKVKPVSRRALIMNQILESEDSISKQNNYRHRESPESVKYPSDLHCRFSATATTVGPLLLRIQYSAEDWLFIKRYEIKADEETFTLDVSGFGDVERDNNVRIWEWHTRTVGKDDMKMLMAISNAKEVVLRSIGKQYYRDRTLPNAEKQRLRVMLAAYEILRQER